MIDKNIAEEIEDLYQELDKTFLVETRLPGDISVEDLMKRYNRRKETIRVKMNGLIASGEWERVKVCDPKAGNITVYRKVQK